MGREIPDDESVTINGISLKLANVPSPCILLDNGSKVYGHECLWLDEEHVKQYEKASKKISYIHPDSYRANELRESRKVIKQN